MEGTLPSVLFIIGKLDITAKYEDQKYQITVDEERQYYTSDLTSAVDFIMILAEGSRICSAHLLITENQKLTCDLSNQKHPEKDIKRMLRMCSNLYIVK
jgi:hypothetical protein